MFDSVIVKLLFAYGVTVVGFMELAVCKVKLIFDVAFQVKRRYKTFESQNELFTLKNESGNSFLRGIEYVNVGIAAAGLAGRPHID